MFQTTPQIHSIIKTKVLVIMDGFLKVRLIIIKNIHVIVSSFFFLKSPSLSMVSLTMVLLSDFSASHTHLLLSSSLFFSLLFCLL